MRLVHSWMTISYMDNFLLYWTLILMYDHTIFIQNMIFHPRSKVSCINVIHRWMNFICGWKCHPLINKSHPWMRVLFMDVIHEWHPRMKTTDDRLQLNMSHKDLALQIFTVPIQVFLALFFPLYIHSFLTWFWSVESTCFVAWAPHCCQNILLDYNGIRNTGKTCTFHSQNITAITTPSKDKHKIVKTLNWRKVQITSNILVAF